jgi:hypothetical protein
VVGAYLLRRGNTGGCSVGVVGVVVVAVVVGIAGSSVGGIVV